MYAKAIILSFFMVWVSFGLTAQHFIGKSKDEVRKLMAEYQKEMTEDETVKNPVFDLIRYSDRFENQTVLFVFKDGLCSYSKKMCDYSQMKEITKELNDAYTRSNDSTWYYQADCNEYIISLKKQEWYFVIDTRKLEK